MSNAEKIVKSEAEWRPTLTPEEFNVTRKHGTERAFSHPYHREKSAGLYCCVCCGAPLFSSETKYEFRHWLAEFLRARRGGSGERARRPVAVRSPDLSALRQMRSTSWPRLSRWSKSNRTALLYQWRCLETRRRRKPRQNSGLKFPTWMPNFPERGYPPLARRAILRARPITASSSRTTMRGCAPPTGRR